MKAIFLSLIFCLGSVNLSLAQLAETESQKTPQELYEFHIQKKKANLTAAWVVLGGGVALIAGGIATNINKCLLSDCQDGMPLVYSGIGVGLTSFVLFSNAGDHRKKANIQLQNGAVGLNKEFKYSGISIAFTF
ncbi:hypothetical protein MWU50_06470 [Flavobacteriaceae bacterium S0862]|nr:hypothetical protein [Flavobacteriaceae bacterium S0862]